MTVFFIAFLVCSSAEALETDTSTTNTTSTDTSSQAENEQTFAEPIISIAVGSFAPSNDPQLTGQENGYSIGAGVAWPIKKHPNVSANLSFLGITRRIDTPVSAPVFGTISGTTDVTTISMLVGIKASWPTNENFRIGLNGGVGYFSTRLSATGTLLGIPGTYEERDNALGIYYGAGAQYTADNLTYGLEYRRIDLKGTFSDFGLKDLDIGGGAVLLTLTMPW